MGTKIRYNPFVRGERVIIAPERLKRPQNTNNNSCPFCHDHEKETTPEVLSYRYPGTKQNGNGWWLRIVTNMFPIFAPENIANSCNVDEIYRESDESGVHEVIILDEHDKDFGHPQFDSNRNQTREVFWAFHERKQQLIRLNPELEYIQLIKNWKKEAGASLEHAHLQIIGNQHIPGEISDELAVAKSFFERKGDCIYCRSIQKDLSDKTRLILETERFVSVAPFFSKYPYEIMILPKEHLNDFYFQNNPNGWNLATDLSHIVRETFKRLDCKFNNPPYNWWLHDSPLKKEDSIYHWHLEIVPKVKILGVTPPGAYEIGFRDYTNPILPEQAAEELRNAI